MHLSTEAYLAVEQLFSWLTESAMRDCRINCIDTRAQRFTVYLSEDHTSPDEDVARIIEAEASGVLEKAIRGAILGILSQLDERDDDTDPAAHVPSTLPPVLRPLCPLCGLAMSIHDFDENGNALDCT